MVGLFLPDTNILVYALKGIEPYATWFSDQINKNQIVISAVVIAEYLSGANKKEEEVIAYLTSQIDVLPVDLEVSMAGAKYKRDNLKKTKKVWLSDCLIAGTCKVYNAILVTEDKKDFPMKDIRILSNFK